MSRHRTVLLAPVVAALTLLALPACSVADPPALTVNGWTLSRDEFLTEVRQVESSPALMQQLGLSSGAGTTGDTSEIPTSLTSQLLSVIVQYRLLVDEAASRGISIDGSRAQAQQQIDQALQGGASATGAPPSGDASAAFAKLGPLRNTLVDGAAARLAISKADANDAELEAEARGFYEQSKAQFTDTCLQAILVLGNEANATPGAQPTAPTEAELAAAKAEATALKTRLNEGADFAELARTESDDAETGAQGGNFPCASAAELGQQLPEEIIQAVEPLPVGGITDVIELSSGAALFRVRDRQQQSFEDVKAQLIQSVQQSKEQTSLSDTLRGASSRAAVRVDPLFGQWEPLKGQVAPPSGAATPSTISPLLGGGGQQSPIGGGQSGGPPAATP